MNDDHFDRLFKYMEGRFDSMEEKLDETAQKDDLEHLKNTMDDFIRRISDNDAENAARDAQLARLVEWAREVSEKTGIPMPNL